MRELEVLGWVVRSQELPLVKDDTIPLRMYELTAEGRDLLPRFISHYQLRTRGDNPEVAYRRLEEARAANRAREELELREAEAGPLTRLLTYVLKHSTVGQTTYPAAHEDATWLGEFARFGGAFTVVLAIGLAALAAGRLATWLGF
ncbi:MAG: hypothetical protein V2J14_00815 [Erythrobacter sp.]|jgi:hypothetical protein|nr:hypothetical protein [Erythrobacter sp.]